MNILKDIKRHEGFRSKVYKCSQGFDTIGYGFAIKDLEIDKDIADLILMRKIKKLLESLIKVFPWFDKAPDNVKYVVLNMSYQLGIRGFSKFKKTIRLIEQRKYPKASIEMLDSLWAKQTPNRAKELSEEIAK